MNETTSGVGASVPAPEGRVRFEERNLGSCPGRTWLVWVDGEAAAWIFEAINDAGENGYDVAVTKIGEQDDRLKRVFRRTHPKDPGAGIYRDGLEEARGLETVKAAIRRYAIECTPGGSTDHTRCDGGPRQRRNPFHPTGSLSPPERAAQPGQLRGSDPQTRSCRIERDQERREGTGHAFALTRAVCGKATGW